MEGFAARWQPPPSYRTECKLQDPNAATDIDMARHKSPIKTPDASMPIINAARTNRQ